MCAKAEKHQGKTGALRPTLCFDVWQVWVAGAGRGGSYCCADNWHASPPHTHVCRQARVVVAGAAVVWSRVPIRLLVDWCKVPLAEQWRAHGCLVLASVLQQVYCCKAGD